jgi:hypothetical protein
MDTDKQKKDNLRVSGMAGVESTLPALKSRGMPLDPRPAGAW